MHHATLKAAVNKYGQLHAEGKSEDEIKIALEQDEKLYSDEDIVTIYEAIVNPDAGSKSGKKKAQYKVVSEFRDKGDFNKVNKVGSSFKDSDQSRVAMLLELKLIEAVESDEDDSEE